LWGYCGVWVGFSNCFAISDMPISEKVILEKPSRLGSAVGPPIRSKPLMASAFILIGVFAIADFGSRGVLISVLYAVPLVVMARAGYSNTLRWVTAALVVLIYAVYFGKWAIHSHAQGATPFDYKLLNRTFVVLAICMLEVLLKLRVSTEHLRGDVELSEALRHEEDETDETLAILLGVGLTTAIALADFLSPANYNLAILYMVPLFLCAWTRSRRLLWGMLAVSLMLSAAGFVCGPPTTSAHTHIALMIANRVLAALAITLLAVLLHFQIGERSSAARLSDSRRQSGRPA
jgi:hypothetical protein